MKEEPLQIDDVARRGHSPRMMLMMLHDILRDQSYSKAYMRQTIVSNTGHGVVVRDQGTST